MIRNRVEERQEKALNTRKFGMLQGFRVQTLQLKNQSVCEGVLNNGCKNRCWGTLLGYI